MGDTIKINVTGNEGLEEIYFLIRTGVWHPEHVNEYLAHKAEAAYSHGLVDAQQDGYSGGDVDDAYTRGYDVGHNDGYKDGYADGSRETSYNDDSRHNGRW